MTLTELYKQKARLRNETELLELEISRQKTLILKEKITKEKTILKKINQEFIDVFGENERLRKTLFSKINDLVYYNPMPYGLKKRLNELDLVYVWQIVIRTKTDFEQAGILGSINTKHLEDYLKNMGLYLGMRLC